MYKINTNIRGKVRKYSLGSHTESPPNFNTHSQTVITILIIDIFLTKYCYDILVICDEFLLIKMKNNNNNITRFLQLLLTIIVSSIIKIYTIKQNLFAFISILCK